MSDHWIRMGKHWSNKAQAKLKRDVQVFSTKRLTFLSFVLVCFLPENKFSVAMNIGCAVFLFLFLSV